MEKECSRTVIIEPGKSFGVYRLNTGLTNFPPTQTILSGPKFISTDNGKEPELDPKMKKTYYSKIPSEGQIRSLPEPLTVDELIANVNTRLIKEINCKFPVWMIDEHLDPLALVIKKEETDSIDLGVCTAKASLKFRVKNLKGLSSMVVNSISLLDLEQEMSDKTGTVSGKCQVHLSFSKDISVDARASASAKCGIVKESIGISCSASVKGVKGVGEATFKANISEEGACFEMFKISNIDLNYDSLKNNIDFRVGNVGIFGMFKPVLKQMLIKTMESSVSILGSGETLLLGPTNYNISQKSTIKNEIAKISKQELNNLLKDMVPVCE